MPKRREHPRKRLPPGPAPAMGSFAKLEGDLAKAHPEIGFWLREVHRSMVEALAPEGEDHMPPAKAILLGRVMAKLSAARMFEQYLAKAGLLDRKALQGEPGVLQAAPLVTTWLSVQNALLRDLMALGLEKVELQPRVLTPGDLLVEVSRDLASDREGLGGPRSNDPGPGNGSGRAEEPGAGDDQPGESGPSDLGPADDPGEEPE